MQSFKPFGKGIVYLANDPVRGEKEKRKNKFGTIVHFEHEESASSLYYLNFKQIKKYYNEVKVKSEEEAKKMVKPIVEISKHFEEPLRILNFICSPNNDSLYLNCRLRDDLVY